MTLSRSLIDLITSCDEVTLRKMDSSIFPGIDLFEFEAVRKINPRLTARFRQIVRSEELPMLGHFADRMQFELSELEEDYRESQAGES